MKKLLPLTILIVSCTVTLKAQYVDIPDSNFSFLKGKYPGCFNANGQMDTTCADIVNEDSLQFHIYYVSNIDAVKYFKRLRFLDCSLNGGGNIQHLAIPDSLTYFNCSSLYNLLELPALPHTLQYLICNYLDDLTTLPDLPPALKYLYCSNGFRLVEMPALPATLKYLNCGFCRLLPALPALPQFLDSLNCLDCSITTFPALPATIKFLNCANNPIFHFPTFPDSITYLDCNGFGSYFPDLYDTTAVTWPAGVYILQTEKGSRQLCW